MVSFFCRYAPNRFGSVDLVSVFCLDAGGSARESASPPYVFLNLSLRSKPLWQFKKRPSALKYGACRRPRLEIARATFFDAFEQTDNYFTSRACSVLGGESALRAEVSSERSILRKIEVNPMPVTNSWHTRDQRTASKKFDEPFKNIHVVYCSLLYNPLLCSEPCLVAGHSAAKRSLALGIFKAWRCRIGASGHMVEPAGRLSPRSKGHLAVSVAPGQRAFLAAYTGRGGWNGRVNLFGSAYDAIFPAPCWTPG